MLALGAGVCPFTFFSDIRTSSAHPLIYVLIHTHALAAMLALGAGVCPFIFFSDIRTSSVHTLIYVLIYTHTSCYACIGCRCVSLHMLIHAHPPLNYVLIHQPFSSSFLNLRYYASCCYACCYYASCYYACCYYACCFPDIITLVLPHRRSGHGDKICVHVGVTVTS